MILSNANKALLITLLLSATVVLMAYNVHITKKAEFIAETYFEILSEEELLEEKTEELEDILKSFDELKTNKAFNENRKNSDFEDEEFKETMDKLRSRHDADQEENTSESQDVLEENSINKEGFNKINELIKKQHNNESSEESSSIKYSLVNRTKLYIPPPIYLCEESGKIVITITVNAEGRVIETYYNNASTSNNGCLIDHALQYAKASTFNADASNPKQLGTITFIFKGK